MFSRCNLFLIFSLVLLKVTVLIGLGYSLEGDEVVVLFWGRQWILNQDWYFLSSQDVATWETLSAYLFGGISLLKINPRWMSFFLSLLELFFLYKWASHVHSRSMGILVVIICSTLPYHIFFSLSLGPLNAGFLTSLYLYLETFPSNPIKRFFVTILGLWYYTSFRLILLWVGIKRLASGHFKSLWPEVFGTSFFLGFLFIFFTNDFALFFHKGAYLTERGIEYFSSMYFQSLLIWFIPFFQYFFAFLSQFQFDDLGRAFLQFQSVDTPLTFPLSILFANGIWHSLRRRIYLPYLFLLLLGWLVVGWTATLVHFVFLTPVIAFFIGIGFDSLKLIFSAKTFLRVRIIICLWCSLSLLNLTWQIYNPSPDDLFQEIVTHPIYEVTRLGIKPSETLFVATNQTLYLRYFANLKNLNWTFLYENIDTWFFQTRNLIVSEQIRYLVVLEPFNSNSTNPALKKANEDSLLLFQKYRSLFESNFILISKRSIVLKNNLKVATVYEIDLNARF